LSSFVLNDLEKLSTAELHLLAQQYPYFAGVKSVLAKRENNPQHIQQASWLSADRTALKQYLEQTDAPETRTTEVVQETALPQVITEEIILPGGEAEVPVQEIEAVEEIPEPEQETAIQPEVVPEPQIVIEVIEETAGEEEISEQEAMVEPLAAAIAKKEEKEEAEATELDTGQNLSFDDWLKNFSIGADKKVVLKKEAPKPVENEEKDAAELNKLIASSVPYEIVSKTMTQETQYAKGVSDFINTQKNKQRNRIQQSIAFDGESPITETYAKLLAGQKKYERAIEVYERLILKFPAKSTYFAAQIEKLKTI
jgi:hypothetical protein